MIFSRFESDAGISEKRYALQPLGYFCTLGSRIALTRSGKLKSGMQKERTRVGAVNSNSRRAVVELMLIMRDIFLSLFHYDLLPLCARLMWTHPYTAFPSYNLRSSNLATCNTALNSVSLQWLISSIAFEIARLNSISLCQKVADAFSYGANKAVSLSPPFFFFFRHSIEDVLWKLARLLASYSNCGVKVPCTY